MLATIIRKFLFILVHFIISVFFTIQKVQKRFRSKIRLFEGEVFENEAKYVLQNVSTLNKKLDHLVILVNSEEQKLETLSSLVIWCLIAGIPFVSFYDVTGFLKENEEKLFFEVEKKKKGIPGCIKWSHKPDLNGYSNGIQPHKITVNIFTNKDGRIKLAHCIEMIAKGEIKCQKSSTEYTAQELDEAISSHYPNIPNPDLLVYMGHLCCTYGLFPWQIRLMEFVKLSVDNNVDVKDFVCALYKYNKCEQRFGK